MTLAQAKSLFIYTVYGNQKNYRKARKDDYCAAQLAWSIFMDALYQDGQITEKQWRNAIF